MLIHYKCMEGCKQEPGPIHGGEADQGVSRGVKKGALEAAQEIKKGVVTIYTFGFQNVVGRLDKVQTGYPFSPSLVALIDDEILGRSAGRLQRSSNGARRLSKGLLRTRSITGRRTFST